MTDKVHAVLAKPPIKGILRTFYNWLSSFQFIYFELLKLIGLEQLKETHPIFCTRVDNCTLYARNRLTIKSFWTHCAWNADRETVWILGFGASIAAPRCLLRSVNLMRKMIILSTFGTVVDSPSRVTKKFWPPVLVLFKAQWISDWRIWVIQGVFRDLVPPPPPKKKKEEEEKDSWLNYVYLR